MIDLGLLEKGVSYKNLNHCIVIFICDFDLFGQGRHIYTFENICQQDLNIRLNDGTVKIFLNAKGTMNDVSEELKAFLSYVDSGSVSDDAFVTMLDVAVKKARANIEWRREYMTLYMREQEIYEEAREEGLAEGREKGRAEGREEGRAEGRLEGKAEGREEGRILKVISSVKIMHGKGIVVSDIAQFLNEPVTNIEQILLYISKYPECNDTEIYSMLKQIPK